MHIVLELCSGGELFDRIVKMGHYSEKDAARLTRKMLEVIAFCHEMGVIHRCVRCGGVGCHGEE